MMNDFIKKTILFLLVCVFFNADFCFSEDGLEEITDSVKSKLDYYEKNKSGQRVIRESLERMKPIENDLKLLIEKNKVPFEILAIPLVESGFRQCSVLKNKSKITMTAGLWQFVPSTARRFGLKVNGRVDERCDVFLSTEAALKYLAILYQNFESWPLAILAYNMGEFSIKKKIKKAGSRDPWKILKLGKVRGDREYLQKIIAVGMILKKRNDDKSTINESSQSSKSNEFEDFSNR